MSMCSWKEEIPIQAHFRLYIVLQSYGHKWFSSSWTQETNERKTDGRLQRLVTCQWEHMQKEYNEVKKAAYMMGSEKLEL